MAAACRSLQQEEKGELQPYDGCGDPLAVCSQCRGGPVVLLPRQASSAPPPEMSSSSGSGSGSGRSATEARALKIHSEAERRRRERINAHLAALRRMVPDAKQMDKATLLARVVDQVKDLKRRASEATSIQLTPAQTDEVSVECGTGDDDDDNGHSSLYMKASVSCDDRPGLIAGLIGALHGLRLRPVRAEVTSLGGRVQHVFTLCNEEGNADCAGLRSLKEAVRQALAKVASPELLCGSNNSSVPFQSKRQRILESGYSVMSI